VGLPELEPVHSGREQQAGPPSSIEQGPVPIDAKLGRPAHLDRNGLRARRNAGLEEELVAVPWRDEAR